MSTPYPPASPPPRRRNNAWIAVVIGIVVVLAIIIGVGIFVISRVVHINVTGAGNDEHVSIQSPFGGVQVEPKADLTRLDMPIYPGAVQVLSSADSPFDNSSAAMGNFGGLHGMHFTSPGAEVLVHGGRTLVMVNIAEFRTSAKASDVLAFYQKKLGVFGPIQHKWEGSTQTLQVKLSDSNVRAVSVRQGRDGTHLRLVRAEKTSDAR
ncbi:MAG: hypothetical protein ACRD1F_04200 [Terriglobales bacterium]